jgi:hypothetical protein
MLPGEVNSQHVAIKRSHKHDQTWFTKGAFFFLGEG